jgi:hypothetical protein
MTSHDRRFAEPSYGTLSEFLNFLELRGQTWCFVETGESSGFSVPPGDDVIFYAMIKGSARIAGVGDDIIELQPGHVAMILSGEAHALRNQPTSPADILDFLRQERSVDIPPVIAIGGGPVTTRILCGRLKVNLPGGLRRMSLPSHVTLGDLGTASAAIRCETLQLQAAGCGAAALLTRTASLMLATSLRNHSQCPILFRLSATNDPVARALQLIGSDPAADWSVAGLAKRVGMGRSNFAACFMAKGDEIGVVARAARQRRRGVVVIERICAAGADRDMGRRVRVNLIRAPGADNQSLVLGIKIRFKSHSHLRSGSR